MSTTPELVTADLVNTASAVPATIGNVLAADWVHTWLRGLKPNTACGYVRDLGLFTESNGYGTDVGRMTADLLHADGHPVAAAALNSWKADMLDEGKSPATINRRLSSVRSLVRHAHNSGLIAWTVSVKGVPSKSYRNTAGPGLDVVRNMVASLDADTPKATRDRALVRLMFDIGLRRGEVVALDLVDVDTEACTVMVIGKGKRESEPMTIADRTLQALAAWIGHRGAEAGPLFVNFDRARKGERLTGRSAARIIAAVGQAVGAENVRPHGLRHTAITTALDTNNGNTRAAQKFSRHARLETLSVYDDRRTDMAGEIARTISELV